MKRAAATRPPPGIASAAKAALSARIAAGVCLGESESRPVTKPTPVSSDRVTRGNVRTLPSRFPPHRGRPIGRGLWRPGQGEHVPQLLRDPDRLRRLHGRPESVQTRPLHAGDPHPDPPARAPGRDATGHDLDPAVEPDRRDQAPARLCSRVGSALPRRHPGRPGPGLTTRARGAIT